jgi:GntR family transcriptional regulator
MAQNTIEADGTVTRDARSRYRREQREQGGAHGAFEAETVRQGGQPRAEVEVRREAAPADVAALLGVEAGTEVVVRARRMYDGGRLVQLADTWIPADVAEAAGIEQVDTGQGGIISRMAEAGHPQADVLEVVEQHAASADEASALGVEPGASLLRITHTGTTEAGRAVEVTRHLLAPGWRLLYSVPLD